MGNLGGGGVWDWTNTLIINLYLHNLLMRNPLQYLFSSTCPDWTIGINTCVSMTQGDALSLNLNWPFILFTQTWENPLEIFIYCVPVVISEWFSIEYLYDEVTVKFHLISAESCYLTRIPSFCPSIEKNPLNESLEKQFSLWCILNTA